MAKNQNVDPNEEEREEMTVTLTLDDDTELECAVLTIFEAAGRDYIALLPLDGAEDEEGEVYLYRYSEACWHVSHRCSQSGWSMSAAIRPHWPEI